MDILLYSTDDVLACSVSEALAGCYALCWITAAQLLGKAVVEGIGQAVVIDGAHEDADLICGWLSRISDVPLIVIAPGTAVDERVRSLQAGADDTLARPFESENLRARLHARMRRAAYNRRTSTNPHQVVDHDLPHAIQEHLPSVEARLLTVLQSRCGSFVRVEELQRLMNGKEGLNNLRSHIFHLRRRMAHLGMAPRIETRYGYGYRLVNIDDTRDAA